MKSCINVLLLVLCLATPAYAQSTDVIRFEITVLPELGKYAALMRYPAYGALALENAGLSPAPGTKLIAKERGRAIELRNGVARFEGKKGELYTYEAGLRFSVANIEKRITFPVVVDLSAVTGGKVKVEMSPPLAALLPGDFRVRVQQKIGMAAGEAAQRRLLAYLDGLAAKGGGGSDFPAMVEAILLDAYNRSGGPGDGTANSEQPLVSTDQWLLIITFLIWLALVSALLALHARRQRRSTRPDQA